MLARQDKHSCRDHSQRNTYICRVEVQRPNIGSGQRMYQVLFFRRIAHDVHDEPATFHIQRERLGQGQSGRSSDYHHFSTPTVPCALGSPLFSQRSTRLIPLEYDRAAGNNHDARQDSVSVHPLLRPFKPTRDHSDGRRRRRTRLDVLGQPLHLGESLAHESRGAFDISIDIVRDVVGVVSQLGRNMRDLCAGPKGSLEVRSGVGNVGS